MPFLPWIRGTDARILDRGRRSRGAPRRPWARPSLETLEGRVTPSTVHAAVWLDGNTTPGGGGNGIVTSLANAFGPSSYQLVSTSDLDTPGFLAANGFNVVIVSRYGSSFGTFLDPTAASNLQAYVGAAGSPGQGGVAVFTNDAADNFFGASNGDPYDANLDRLFTNAVQFAADTGHGYVGEFNGAVMAMSSNTSGAAPIGLLAGSAGSLHFVSPPFVYQVGPIGAGNPIDNGVTFPFTDPDQSTFRTDVTGADPGNIVDVYQDNNGPAVLANDPVIHGGTLVDTTTTLTSSPNPSTFGQSVTFTATVTANSGGGTPGGSVEFFDGATSLGTQALDASGSASISTSSLAVGTHTITAAYSGDAGDKASTSDPLTQTVIYAATVLGGPAKAKQSGSTLPVKLEVTDASNNNLSSPDLLVTAVGIAPAGSSSPTMPAQNAGGSNPGGLFRYDPTLQGYVFNLQLSDALGNGLAPGDYTLFYTIGGDPTLHTYGFSVKS